jgi:xylulokinase
MEDGRPTDHGRQTDEILLAIDVGTSGARAAAFDTGGNRLLEVRRGYPIHSPQPGWAEQDGRGWRDNSLAALGGAIRQLRSLRPGARVRGISLTGQCPSMVPVDERGEPVGPGLMYRDNRAVAEAASFVERFGAEPIHRRTGHLPAAFHVGPKVLWLRAHRPDVFRATTRILQPRDLVAFALTGEQATDGTHAAATLFFDLRARAWDGGLFDAFDLDHDLFPPVRSSSEVVGELRPALVRRFGLTGPVPVVLGGADSQACAFGAGVVSPGPVSEMAGSSTCLNSVVEAPLADVRVTHYTHVVPGGFTTETGLNTTGEAVRWIAALLYGGRAGRPGGADFGRLDAEAAAAPPGADGVLAITALADGERDDPDVRGAFTGLSMRHGRAILARAMLEGVAYAIRGQLELLRGAGAPVEELRVSGGDARLATWNQIKADVTGLPVVRIDGDAAAGGVAMLAGIGAGVYAGADEAIARAVRPVERIEPDSRVRRRYEDGFEAWRVLAASAVTRRNEAED